MNSINFSQWVVYWIFSYFFVHVDNQRHTPCISTKSNTKTNHYQIWSVPYPIRREAICVYSNIYMRRKYNLIKKWPENPHIPSLCIFACFVFHCSGFQIKYLKIPVLTIWTVKSTKMCFRQSILLSCWYIKSLYRKQWYCISSE